jgi:cephalosporin hydroxylase
MKSFDQEVTERIDANGDNAPLREAAHRFIEASAPPKYSYNFSWLGRPIIQYPQDIVALQELIWRLKPDLVIETGIAHGGSLILSASMLELNAACGGRADGEVIGIDIDIRAHNREAIERHPLFRRIRLLEGSSVAPDIVVQVADSAHGKECVLVLLDSNHSHEHVLAELEAYAPLTSVGSYCVVYDTIVEDLPAELYPDRPWGPGDNPKTAVHAYLSRHPEFEIDKRIDHQLMLSVAPDGYLRRVR